MSINENDLAEEIRTATTSKVGVRQSVVQTVSSDGSCTVDLGKSGIPPYPVAWPFPGYVPVAGDGVMVLKNGADLMVIGTTTGKPRIYAPGAVNALTIPLSPSQSNVKVSWHCASSVQDSLMLRVNNDAVNNYHSYGYEEYTNGSTSASYGETNNATTFARLARSEQTGQPGTGGSLELYDYNGAFSLLGVAHSSSKSGTTIFYMTASFMFLTWPATSLVFFLAGSGTTFVTASRFTVSYF